MLPAHAATTCGRPPYRPYTGDDWRPSTAWHTDFQDVDNDGPVDLFIAKGEWQTVDAGKFYAVERGKTVAAWN
ncbi:hypothetical protein [Rhizobium sp.]